MSVRRRAGFSLIELVISTALMSLILGAAYLCLQAGLASQRLVQTREESLQNARVAAALIAADLRSTCPLSKDIEFLGMRRKLGQAQADNLDFATHNYTPRRLNEGDWCEVSYFLEKDPESADLVLWRRRDPTPDDEPLAGGTREEIARGIHGLSLEYYDGFDWYEEWGDLNGRAKQESSWRDRPNLVGLPEAVRITLSVAPVERRSKSSSAATAAAEPPLVVQTVARLELAAASASLRSSGGTASTNSSSALPSTGAPVIGPGGGQ